LTTSAKLDTCREAHPTNTKLSDISSSNDLPRRHPCPNCSCDRTGRPRSVSSLDARISAARDELRALLVCRNSLAPIHRLPAESLLHVFQYVAEADPGVKVSNTIVSVCRQWRDLGLGYPFLWSYVYNTPTRAIDLQLSRSVGAPLTVSFSFPSDASPILTTLRQLYRIQTFRLLSSDNRLITQVFIQLQERAAPILTHLHLRLPKWPHLSPVTLYMAPQLSDVTLACVSPEPFRALLGRSLRHLSVDNHDLQVEENTLEIEEWIRVLSGHPLLEELTLRYAIYSTLGRPPAAPITNAVRLSRLRYLRITDQVPSAYQFLRRLVLPRVQRVNITVGNGWCYPPLWREFAIQLGRLASPIISSLSSKCLTLSSISKSHVSLLTLQLGCLASESTALRKQTELVLGLCDVHRFNHTTKARFTQSAEFRSLCSLMNPDEVRIYDKKTSSTQVAAIMRILSYCKFTRTLTLVGSSSLTSPILCALHNQKLSLRERSLPGLRKLILEETVFNYYLACYVVGAFAHSNLGEIQIVRAKNVRREYLQMFGMIASRVCWDGLGYSALGR
jgi:hypothetical protein